MCHLVGRGRETYSVVVGKPEVRHLEDLSIDGRIILKWVLENRVEGREL
jgi:hypothetical protein